MSFVVGAILLTVAGCISNAETPIAVDTEATIATADLRASVERRMLDDCVYRQYRRVGEQRMQLIENCRCATRTAIGSLKPGDFAAPRSGGLSAAQSSALAAGVAACFRTG